MNKTLVKCDKCSEIFDPIYKNTIFIYEQTKDTVKSRKQNKRIYKKSHKKVGYICTKCGTIEFLTPFYNQVKKTIQELKTP